MAYSVIKKGVFPSCRDNLISLNQYLLVKEDGRQFLLLKFFNGGDKTINAVKLTVAQKDTAGLSLETLNVEYKGIDAEGGTQFVGNKIALSDYCGDFVINITAADFGKGYIANKKEKDLKQEDKKQEGEPNQSRINIKGDASKSVSTCKFKPSIAVCAIIFAIFALSAFIIYGHLYITKANSKTFFYNGVEYAFEKGDKSPGSPVYVVGSKSRIKNVIIEEKIKGHTVTRIAESAFENNHIIEKLTVKGAVEIEKNAFANCIKLSAVNLGQTVSIIGEYAFTGSGLKVLNASNLSVIGGNAFSYCKSLESIKISNAKSVLRIERAAFMWCERLAEIDIDQYVDYSENYAIFSNCYNVKSLRLKNLNHSFSLDGALYADTKNGTVLSLFGNPGRGSITELSSLVIDYCDAIPADFCNSLPLESVTVKNGNITGIGDSAFRDCDNLTKLDIPSILTRAENFSFYGTALTSFEGVKLEYIGNYAFGDCKKLSEFKLQDNTNLNHMGIGAFSGCIALTNIVVPPRITAINARAFELCRNLSDAFLGGGIESIGNFAFSGCISLQALNLPQSLKSIGDNAFEDCAQIKTAIIPSNVTSIGYAAFFNCAALKEISVPFVGGSINFNGFFAYIFGGQDISVDFNMVPIGLERVTITATDKIGANAFYGCANIKRITIESSLKSIGQKAFYGCRGLTAFVIPDTVTAIDENAFEGCYKLFEVYNLSKLNITRSQTFGKAGYYALKIYKSLAEQPILKIYSDGYEFMQDDKGEWYLTNFDETKTTLSFSNLFYNNQNYNYMIVKYLAPDNDKITGVYFYNATAIGEYAFSNCTAIKSVRINEGVSSIGFGAFYNCHAIEEIEIPNIGGPQGEDSRYFGYMFGAEYFYDSGNYVSYSLKKVTITSSITAISDNAFYNCYNIETIILPDTVTSIGDNAFSGCSALIDFILPPHLNSIGEQAFLYCQKIKEIGIYSSVETVGDRAFYGCMGLEWVAVWDDVVIGEEAFYGCSSLYYVSNLSNATMTAGSKDYGYIAYYALTVQKSANPVVIQQAVIDGKVFKYYGDNWTLTDYTGTASSLNLSDITHQGKTISAYSIRPRAFGRKDYPAALTIGKAVTYIYEYAFEYCQGLNSVKFENSTLKELSDDAFYGCYSLVSIDLPQGLIRIGYGVFMYCSQLLSIRIPSTITEIRNNAFFGCYALCDVYIFSNKITVVKGDSDNGCVAFYALRVSTTDTAPLETAVSGEFKFVLYEGDWYLIAIAETANPSVLTLPKFFVHNGTTITSYILMESALADRSYYSVYIPKAVGKIHRTNDYYFNFAIESVNYEGTLLEWNEIVGDLSDSPFKRCTIYYEM